MADEQKRIAEDTKQSYLQDRTTGRTYTDPSYAVDAYKSSVARSMKSQGEAASKQTRKRGSK